MKLRSFVVALFLLPVLQPASAQQKPNIIFILTDDQGYGDVGAFFQQQRMKNNDRAKPWHITPHLDSMAANGAKLTQLYCNAPVCAPSRASLLTGMNQGNASVRDNQFDKALENNHTIATVLRQAGYATIAVGKWGLQGKGNKDGDWPAHPLKRGFTDYFGYIRHADGHEHYPVEGLYRGKKQVWNNYSEISSGLTGCYTTDLWTAYAKKSIAARAKRDNSTPFFMFLAYDAPHAVLELPAQAYPAGSGSTGGLQWLGQTGHMINTASGKPDTYIYPEYDTATYDHDGLASTPDQPWPDTYKRYATAIRRIDDGIGDIIQLLKDLGIYDNTLIVFSSDNGPSIESYLPDSYVANSPAFFGGYGPFDGIKRDCWEGGLRMPVLATWPRMIQAGTTVEEPGMLSDWLATFADAAGLPIPARTDGVSLLPALTGKGKQQKSLVYVEYTEGGKTPVIKDFERTRQGRRRGQMQMLRVGNITGVRYDIKTAGDNFELYDVVKDPKETNNLADRPGYDSLQQFMKDNVLQLRRSDTDARRPYDTAAVPADRISAISLATGLRWKQYTGTFPWPGYYASDKAFRTGISKDPGVTVSVGSSMLRFDGYIFIPADGIYDFSVQTFGTAYVRLHDATLIDADFGYKKETRTTSIKLNAGYHAITVYHLNNAAKEKPLKFQWKKPGDKWKAVPAANFFHAK